jgi:hypothetical protein
MRTIIILGQTRFFLIIIFNMFGFTDTYCISFYQKHNELSRDISCRQSGNLESTMEERHTSVHEQGCYLLKILMEMPW